MDKKTKTIALIIVTLLIWGYSALEWFNYIEASDDTEITNSFSYVPVSSPIELKENKQVELKLNYRDPFLNSSRKKKRPELSNRNSFLNTSKRTSPSPIVKVEAIKWPEIAYSGIINNSFGLLNISGSDYIVKDGDIKGQVAVINVFSDKVILKFSDELKEIKKKN